MLGCNEVVLFFNFACDFEYDPGRSATGGARNHHQPDVYRVAFSPKRFIALDVFRSRVGRFWTLRYGRSRARMVPETGRHDRIIQAW